MTPRVDAATARHADAIRDLDGLSPPSRRLLDHDLDAADCSCLVASVDTEVVGYAAALVAPDRAEIIDVVVGPVWRRRGIATQLVAELLERVERRGTSEATLEVREGNVGAQALYRRFGFVIEGRRPGYYPDGEDALIMWRRRQPPGRGTVQELGTRGRS